ncbi:hypothetical protein HanPSC8_Chr14g0622071 [Helianthus annuus]|nr:hypothetical protein HanPSC8_Chr14g0622071 [Helianthus annuus]
MYGTSTIIRRILGIASTMRLSAPKASTGPKDVNYTRIIVRYRRKLGTSPRKTGDKPKDNWGQAQITGVEPKDQPLKRVLVPDIQYMGGSRGVHFGPATMTQASGSYFQPAESYTQHLGSFMSLGSSFVPGSSQVQGSSFVPGSSQVQGSSFVPGSSQVQGSSFVPGSSQVQGSSLVPGSSQVQGSSFVPGSSQVQGSLQIPGSLKNLQTGSLDVHQGDFIPMQTIASTGPSITPESQQYGFTPNVPNLNPMRGNTFNNSLTTNHGFMQDTGINHAMARELQKLKDMISSVPGVVKPIPEIADGSHKVSRFAPPICDAEIPKRFHIPTMKLYDGTTDPEEHIAQYRERMEINPIPEKLKEACLCKGFGSTLTGSALKWLLFWSKITQG